MALTPLQRRICRLLADARKQGGESYVAGAALNELLAGARKSRDVDLFHDAEETLAATWEREKSTLTAAGRRVAPSREGPSFVQAQVSDGTENLFPRAGRPHTRYVQGEIDQLAFEGPAPRAADLSRRWHQALDEAREIVRLLPPEHVGRCVLDGDGRLEKTSPDVLAA